MPTPRITRALPYQVTWNLTFGVPLKGIWSSRTPRTAGSILVGGHSAMKACLHLYGLYGHLRTEAQVASRESRAPNLATLCFRSPLALGGPCSLGADLKQRAIFIYIYIYIFVYKYRLFNTCCTLRIRLAQMKCFMPSTLCGILCPFGICKVGPSFG